tara:strand:- start:49002 stop:49892 length:891 start_codon:yes stop_codon:yes gene_type:complete
MVDCLKKNRYGNIITKDRIELDLSDQKRTRLFFKKEKPDVVICAAAKVGGIYANHIYPGQFLFENLSIQNNLIHFSHEYEVKYLLFLGSACIYPKYADQPIKESSILSGPLEPTNEPYALAKIAGIKLCETYYKQYSDNFISIMPNNLYGPNDNFHPDTSHVIPALIQKFHNAKTTSSKYVEIWGTGNPLREFLHVDDLSEAILFIINNVSVEEIYNRGISHINIGSGEELSIHELALMIKNVVGFKGKIKFDNSKPDGTPRKLLDTSIMNEKGWRPKIKLKKGIKDLYTYYKTYV